jgi:hypothetical protein
MAPPLPPLPNLDGIINTNSVRFAVVCNCALIRCQLAACIRGGDLFEYRESIRYSLQKVCQEFDDNAVLLIDENICEPMLKSYLGTPGNAFSELDLPIAHVQPLTGGGLTSATAAKILQHLNIVIIVRNSPIRAQLVAQYVLEIKRCAYSIHSSTLQQTDHHIYSSTLYLILSRLDPGPGNSPACH